MEQKKYEKNSYNKNSLEYQVNRQTLYEMEECIPMTRRERNCLRKWVRKGYAPDINPWDYYDSEGYPLNYLKAFRLEYGYSSGPWDYWKGPENQTYWCEDLKCFLSQGELSLYR